MTTITKRACVAAVEAFLNENPDITTYADIVQRDGDMRARAALTGGGGMGDACFYRTADRQTPLCIVGQVFDRLGIPITEDEEWSPVLAVIGGITDGLDLTVTFTPKARDFLANIQAEQDQMMNLRDSLSRHR